MTRKKEFDFNTDASLFPEVWIAGDDGEISIQKIINKHVYLSLRDSLEGATKGMVFIDRKGRVEISFGFGDHFEKSVGLEEAFLDIEYNTYGKGSLSKILASLRVCIEHVEAIQKNAPEGE